MSQSEEYGMEHFVSSDEYKNALRELRKVRAISTRAERRLVGGYIPKRRRAAKTTQNSIAGSASAAESG